MALKQWQNENVCWKGNGTIHEAPSCFQTRKRTMERNQCENESVVWKRTTTNERGSINKRVGWMMTVTNKEDPDNKESERKKTVQAGSMQTVNNKEDPGNKELERKKTVQAGSTKIVSNEEDPGNKVLERKKTVPNENRPLQGFHKAFSRITGLPAGLVDFKNRNLWHQKDHTFKIPSERTDSSTRRFCYKDDRLHPVK